MMRPRSAKTTMQRSQVSFRRRGGAKCEAEGEAQRKAAHVQQGPQVSHHHADEEGRLLADSSALSTTAIAAPHAVFVFISAVPLAQSRVLQQIFAYR